jgi:uncharacterized membrane protein (DUF4010 family)
MHDFQALPPLLIHFLLAVLFSFVIGLEFHAYQRLNRHNAGFGSTRTFTMIGIFGFGLYALDAHGMLYAVGLAVLSVFLVLYYRQRVQEGNLFVVTMLLLLSQKQGIRQLSETFRGDEMVTLAKFLIMAGVVLPLLPDRQIAPFITVTYYQVWLAILVVSTISYLSYLAQTYFFKQRGFLLTGLLGGLYSSTAATIVIARRADTGAAAGAVSSALILATAMMYLRLLVLILMLGGRADFMRLLGPFALFTIASIAVALFLQRRTGHADGDGEPSPVKHPLEFGAAFAFAVLFVAFTAITHYVVGDFGSSGLHVLAFAVGLTDIDPFILSLLAGQFHVTATAIIGAIVIASGSNNLLKAGYAMALGRHRAVVPAAIWLTLLFLASLAYAWWL